MNQLDPQIRPAMSGLTLAMIVLWAAALPAAEAELPLVEDGRPRSATLDATQEELVRFRVEVPKDAVLMTIQVLDSPLILDILATKGGPIESSKDAEHASSPDVLDPSLRISRQSLPPLVEGVWEVAVGYLGSSAVVHKRPARQIPFRIQVAFVRAKLEGTLEAGKRASGRIRADQGSCCSFAIDVPAGAEVLRLDLDQVTSDLDLLARRGKPILANDEADDTALSPLGRESLVIDRNSPVPLAAGRWYVSVVHPLDFGVVDFSLFASFHRQPPEPLLAIPAMAQSAVPRKRAIQATVDVATEVDGASGTLVSPTGLVLTNYHVVAEVAESPGAEKDPVIIGVTLDPHDAPRELFRGRVVLGDKRLDLALVQITCGLYHQPLPAGYRFPCLPLGESAGMEIGELVSVLGYPSIGGTTGRVSVTLTRGVISGFEKLPIGTLIKTDAGISPGSSGGAALDSHWRLIGVPTFENISPEVVGRMSYIHPVEILPAAWRQRIEAAQGR